MGNRSPYQAPHAVFPCQGEERWIAITVTNDEEWEALVHAIGDPDWARAERFGTLSGRLENQDALEELLGAVTAEWDAYHLMYALQAAGVPAGVVQKTSDLFSDPQVAYRKHFWFLDHQEMGVHAYDGPSFRMSKTPGELTMPAPVMGQHNEFVYKEILGMTEEEYVQDLIDNIFE
tara:strand:- start:18 stop:545 length:528 start_codon:yes stop_codon:yes gene_type:complete